MSTTFIHGLNLILASVTLSQTLFPTSETFTLSPTSIPTREPSTSSPTKQPTPAIFGLQLDEFRFKSICDNLLSASIRIDDISVTKCIQTCQDLSFSQCEMINYFSYWKTTDDSRCYIFDELCSLSDNLENSILNSSQIWYKNQFTQQYCVDYRDYLDNVGDSCADYADFGWCSDNEMSDELTLDQFEQLRSQFTATEACCECGGGKPVFDGISVTYINNINESLLECSFKQEQQSMNDIRKWNNFAAFDLTQSIFDSDILVFNPLKTVVNDNDTVTICDFANYENNTDIINDFFIVMVLENDGGSQLFLNSEFFDLERHILSQSIEILNYEYCLAQIQEYNAEINGIMPCWNQYNNRSQEPTEQPTQSPSVTTVQDTPTTKEAFLIPILPTYAYIFILGGMLVLVVACLFVCDYRKGKRNKYSKANNTDTDIELGVHKYSSEHFAIHPIKKADVDTMVTVSTSFLISSSNIVDEEREPMLLFDEETEHKAMEPGSEGYLEPFVKKRHQTKAGKLVVQKRYYERKQMQFIDYQCSKAIDGEFAYLLFGDNDSDRDRLSAVPRKHFGGQARVMGYYDRTFAYGIITSFVKRNTPNLEQFRLIMDALFIPLHNHLRCGYDIVYTYPSEEEIRTHRDRYYRNGKQVIFHNIGTGIAFMSLSIDHLECIQMKLNELKDFASEKIFVDYYGFNPTKRKHFTVYNPKNGSAAADIEEIKEEKEDSDIENKIYFCPSCGLEKHYLMKFKNCVHRMCEECLRGYIVYDMQYNKESDRERFRCYAYILHKCDGYLCTEDIQYPLDRCKCVQCLQNSTDSGNGTILSDDNYKQFCNILSSFDVKVKLWNKDICPNEKCLKPFVVQRPYQMIESSRGVSEQSIEVIINENRKQLDHCNCCGKISSEIKLNDNICTVCNYWNCNECRLNCFYTVDTNFTQEPAMQILNAFIKYNQNKVKNEGKMCVQFQICEICWFNYYCHICPHCNHTFCGICDIEWKGNTINWLNRNDIIKKCHAMSARHKCVKQKEKLQKQSVHKKYIRINEHRNKLERINLENQKKDEFIFRKEAENFKLKQKLDQMQQTMVQLKIENQRKENMVLSKQLTMATKEKEEIEQKLKDTKYTNVWQWLEDNGKWLTFDTVPMNRIEQLKVGDTYRFSLSSNNQSYTIHKLSTETAEQTNTKSKKKRKMRRIQIETDANCYVSDQKEGCYMTPGANIDIIGDEYCTPKRIELDLNNDKIAQQIKKEFYATAPKSNKIIKIESIQNRYLWDKYYTQKQAMKKSIGAQKLGEKSLWHGTHSSIIEKVIKQGFRKEFNSVHQFGEGTYFAVNSKYSVGYAKSNAKVYQMFQCLVLCGESAIGSKNITLRNWPMKSDRSGQIYDSLVNKMKKPSIYVIHDDTRCYPMFVVHFTKS